MPNGDRQSLPLLPLPTPDPAERSRGRGGPSGIKSWGHGKQKERVQRQLQRLRSAFEDRKQELRGELAGVEPELALVIETAGSIARFQQAVAEIRGLEWLAEYYEPEMAPGDDFYLVSKKKGEEGQKRAFGGTVYLVMSDRQAQQEMLSLWSRVHSRGVRDLLSRRRRGCGNGGSCGNPGGISRVGGVGGQLPRFPQPTAAT